MKTSFAIPHTVSWTAETLFWVAPCEEAAGLLSLHQSSLHGQGKPLFATPHMNRQRRAMARGLCDVCSLPLRNSTKVSLSHERTTDVEGIFLPLVVEPFLHKACARIAAQHCPHLRKQIKSGEIVVRQVFKSRLVAQKLTAEAVQESTGEKRNNIVGHLKMQILNMKVRDLAWLGGDVSTP